MTKKEKEKVVKNIKKLNENLEEENKIIKKFSYSNIQNKEIVISDLLKFNKEEQIMIVYDFIMNTYRKKLSISKNRIKDILKKIESSKPNIILWEEDGILLLKEYTKIINRKNLEEYNFLIDLPIKNITNKIFKLSLKGNSKNKVIMNKEHFPLSVKKIKEKNKKINKYFIKNKIPIFERENWPGLYDKNDELILVIDTDISYNKKVKYKDEKIIFFIERSD